MKTAFAPPTHRNQFYTKFATPLVLESPRHSGLGTILLSRGKHLLGTSGECTVPLRAGDVQPRHALIVVSEHRTVVKALDSRTWVNDGPVSEMALRPGDRLSIGPLTFRVRAADAEEAASIEELPEQTFPDDFIQESASVVKPPANAVAYRDPVRELPLPVVTDPVVEISKSPTTPLPAPVPAPLVPFNRDASAQHGTDAKAFAPATTKNITPPPLPMAVVSVLPPPVSIVEPPLPSATRLEADQAEEAAATATATLDFKLDEIQRTLTELQLPMGQTSATSSTDNVLRTDALAAERRQVSVRQEELQKRADELARQSQLLHERVARVAEREVEVERSLARLSLEHEQLAATAEVTRKELDDEYARHMALWQEWDAAYRRTSGELNGQLLAMEQRRTALLAEGDRLANERSELQRLQAEHERDRRIHAAERVQLTTDLAALQSLRAEFDTERQQHLVAVQEREARVVTEWNAVSAMQEELLVTRQQLERERSEFLAVRSTEALRREQELRGHVERREQLDLDHARIQTRSMEQNELGRVLEAERVALAAQREEFAMQQSDIAADHEELAQLRDRLRTTAAMLLQLQRERERSPVTTTITNAESDVRSATERDWNTQPLDAAPVPPPIPTDWHMESAGASHVPDETNVESSVSVATSNVGESAPSIAATVHRFWEDNALYDTSVEGPSQSKTPSHFVSSSNLMSADSKPQTDSAATDNGDAEPAIDELLADLAGDANVAWSCSQDAVDPEPATEFESSCTTATAISEPPLNADEVDADKTLSEINREFGVPVASAQDVMADTARPALPSWWIDSTPTPAPTAEHQSVGDSSTTEGIGSELPIGHSNGSDNELAHRQSSDSSPSSTPETAAADPLLSLRAELARMFDLSAEKNESHATEEPAEEGAERVDEVAADNDSDALQLTLAPSSNAVDRALADHTESFETIESESQITGPNSEDAVASNESPSAIATADNAAAAESAGAETNGEEEDSMETYLAKLLSRTRGTDVSEHEVKSLTSKPSGGATQSSVSSQGDEDKPVAKFDPADRSHLTAEPKHKQDRQAAREDLQQFRQVAHQSARSALARYTSKALLSAVIAKSMLLGISVTAVCTYVGAPLMGFDLPAWKGVACTFTTGLCIMELHRSWRQLQSWRTTGTLPVKSAPATKNVAVPAVESAAVVAPPEAKPAPSPVG